MNLRSFGCSFVFGNDLPDDGRDGPYATPSQMTWPARLAQRLEIPYVCLAKGGSGNLSIMDRVLRSVAHAPDDIYIIGWTWIDRFDYSDPGGHHENQYVNGMNDWHTLMPIDTGETAKIYYRDLHSEYRDKLTSLIYINTVIEELERRNIRYVMTYMDPLLICRRWNCSPTIANLQNRVTHHLSDFEGKTFLQWSQDRGHEISATLHPLEQAHAEAAEIMWPSIDAILHRA